MSKEEVLMTIVAILAGIGLAVALAFVIEWTTRPSDVPKNDIYDNSEMD